MSFKLLPLLVLSFVCVSPAQAKMYKWIDENGGTHFGDKVPDKFLSKEHTELNEQGATINRQEAAETAEQRKEKGRLARIKREKETLAKEQAKRDRVLLDTYTTERDLDAALKARLDAVDSQLQLSETIVNEAKRKIAIIEKRITGIKASGKDVPKNISDKMKSEEKQLNTYNEVAAEHAKMLNNDNVHKDKSFIILSPFCFLFYIFTVKL